MKADGHPPDDDDTTDDHWLEDHCEQILSRHEGSCVATAVEDAFAHGIDTDDGARQVAAQFLESGDSTCMCIYPKID